MKRHLVLLALGSLLLMLVALPSPTSAAPTGACYLTTSATSMTLASALANAYCVNINLAAGTYYAHGLSFARDVVITGAGSKKTTIDGDGADRIFAFTGAGSTFVLSGVTLKNGHTGGNGGAIYSAGKLVVTDVTFTGNSAFDGGAIEVTGPLTSIQRSNFKTNSATSGAAAVDVSAGSATIDASTFDGNTAPACGAVGSGNNRPIDITKSTFKNNRAATFDGGAVYTSGTTNIESTTFTNNRAARNGGAVFVYAGNTNIKLSTFSGNLAVNYGGGVAVNTGVLDIYTSSFSNNSAYAGGGVASPGASTYAWIETSLFEKNKGQVTTVAALTSPLPSSGPYGKSLKLPAAPTGSPAGGGLLAWDASVLNTTFSGNTTTGRGGGVYAISYVDASFATFSKNTAAEAGGSFYAEGAGSGSWLRNDIFDKGTPDNCAGSVTGFVSKNNNLSSDHSCDPWFGTSDLKAVNPKLSGLAKNGGPTKTHATQTGSPAIHGAPTCKDVYDTVILVDQRLYERPTPNTVVGMPCDIGAYEHR